ncbi:hypothetical protein H7F50_15740 [Novosphingobium flavum]|uniref:hypothetical protein n=1 Tax=Novosphingobium aerophilum TaxID=2839843 RepID=UPI001639857F|nr:hypothetical protein [Novosphingobium aerophilum]MBC2663201.1 hypothetical protein [Novosphingobium aerophilum]
MARTSSPRRKASPRSYRSGTIALPHPSWRRAVEGKTGTGSPRVVSAAEFWAALGLEP